MIVSFFRKNKVSLILGLIFSVSILLRIFPLFFHESWLDEKYSLFFAKVFSWKDLLFTFDSDTHPGLYYLILKFFLKFTQDLIQLRILTSLLPQLVGIGLVLQLVEKVSSKNNKKPLLISSLILGLNPLLIVTSWQLRSYNLVILLIAVVLVAINWFLEKKSFFRLSIVSLFCIMANLSFYGVFVFTFLSLVYCVYKMELRKKISLIILFFFGIFFTLQFFTMAGFKAKHQFELASWLPHPTLRNIPSVFYTLIGLKTRYFIPDNASLIESLFFYFVLLFLIIQSIKFGKKFINSRQYSEWYLLIIAPILTFFIFTFLSLFLSKRIFFHNFVPRLSFLIPRIFIPTIVYFSFYFSLWLGNKKFNYKYYLTIIILSIFLMYNSLSSSLYINYSKVQLKETIYKMTIESSERNTIFYPTWYWINGVKSNFEVEKTKRLIDYSNDFYFKKESSLLDQKNVFVFNLDVESDGMKRDKQKFLEYIYNIGCIERKSDDDELYSLYFCE